MSNGASREAEFLRELSALTARLGIEICGCGCCGSPYLQETKPRPGHYEVSVLSEGLRWVEDKP